MPSLLYKTVKLIFWAIAPFLFVSSGVDGAYVEEPLLKEGGYLLKTSGDFNRELVGEIFFDTYLETSVSGKTFSTLRLNLKNEDNTPLHTLEFLISKQNDKRGVSTGSYTIIPQIDGFLKCFDGAFGVANIVALGEVPFFARKGKIVIGQIEKNRIKGVISAHLHSPNGKRIFVSGNFSAVKKQ